MAKLAAQNCTKVVPAGGYAWKPSSKGPVCGAAAGQSRMVTAMTTIRTDIIAEKNPT